MGKGRGRVRYVGRHSVRYGGIFRGRGRFVRGRGSVYSPKLVSKVITLMNGKRIYYHSSIKFSDNIYHRMTNNQRENFHREIKEYQDKQVNNHGGVNKRSIEHMQIEIDDLKSQVSSSVPVYVSTGPRSHIIQVKTDGTIMGGRIEKIQQNRNRN